VTLPWLKPKQLHFHILETSGPILIMLECSLIRILYVSQKIMYDVVIKIDKTIQNSQMYSF
jgi:hypothetical protein